VSANPCTVGRLLTRDYGEVPVVAIRMGRNVRLCPTPDTEQRMYQEDKHIHAWFERTDAVNPEAFDELYKKLKEASQEPTR